MKLSAFRIQKYRHIQDSRWVELDDDLTCIVGKNQSGKTALLKALYKFNPFRPEPYDMRREWPRGERRARDLKQVVCEVKFAFEREEKQQLQEIVAAGLNSDYVVVTKDYEGNFEIYLPSDPEVLTDRLHPNKADEIAARFPTVQADAGQPFRDVARECAMEAGRLVKEGRFSELSTVRSEHATRLQQALTPGNPQPQHQHESAVMQQYQETLNQIIQEVENLPTIKRQVHAFIVERLPTFIYMDDYKEFIGTADLEEVCQRKQKNQLLPPDETFLMILALSRLDLNQLIEQGKASEQEVIRERQYELEDAAKTLTNDVAGRWGQNPYSVQFRVDRQTFLTEIAETWKDVGMIPLEEQSKGFRWFFSFDLRFMHDSKGTFEGCVLLLDEPGLHLHPGGQQDLLRRLDAYAKKNTLIYTTHLPFLVDLREPSRIRVIREVNKAAEVSADFGASGPDERLTLQAALGMKLDQHYLVAERNLIVEGVDDAWIITELSNVLARLGKPGLPDDVQVTAAGGAPEVVYMASLMIGQNLRVVALFDSDDAGRREEEKLRTRWLLRFKDAKSSTLLLGTAVGFSGDFAIEDMFAEDYYLKNVEQSHKDKMDAARITKITPRPGGGLLVKRFQAGCAEVGIEFNKGSVANLIRKDLAKMAKSDFSKVVKENPFWSETIKKAELLFKCIGQKFC